MNDYRNIITKIMVLALFWAGSGYIIGASIDYTLSLLQVGTTYWFGLMFASLNLLLGMMLLKGLISHPFGDQMFFEGPREDQDGDIRVACLWSMPITLFFIGGLMWLLAFVLRFIEK